MERVSCKGVQVSNRVWWSTKVVIVLAILAIWGLFGWNIANAGKEEGTSKEVSEVTSSFDIPEKEIFKYRAYDAEIKLIGFESRAAIQERQALFHLLLNTWQVRYGIENLEAWRVDTKFNRIFRPNKSPRKESDPN